MPAPETGEKQHLDREIRDMMSMLTRRLARLQKKPTEGGSASSIHEHDLEDNHEGFGIITMAGSNEGATMKGELNVEDHLKEESHPPLMTYLNSNFQGVNNSIMIGGGYSANDPGIHLDVEDHHEQTRPRHGKKGKKKLHSEPSKSDH